MRESQIYKMRWSRLYSLCLTTVERVCEQEGHDCIQAYQHLTTETMD